MSARTGKGIHAARGGVPGFSRDGYRTTAFLALGGLAIAFAAAVAVAAFVKDPLLESLSAAASVDCLGLLVGFPIAFVCFSMLGDLVVDMRGARKGPLAPASTPSEGAAAVSGDDLPFPAEGDFDDALSALFAAELAFALATAALAAAPGFPSIVGIRPEEGAAFAQMVAIGAWFSAGGAAVCSAGNAVAAGYVMGCVRGAGRRPADPTDGRRGDGVA